MFGHTFVRVVKHGRVDEERRELLDHAIEFSATVDTANAFVYGIKGLLGAFPGTFRNVPYHFKVRQYNDAESRDLYEYELALTPPQLEMFLAHLWGVGSTFFDYYYVSENCSYHLLGALEVARPDADLLADMHWPAIPADAVKALYANNLVANVRFRPSLRRQFRTRVAGLVTADLELVEALVVDPRTPLPGDLPKRRAAVVLDAAQELIDIRSKRRDHERLDARSRACTRSTARPVLLLTRVAATRALGHNRREMTATTKSSGGRPPDRDGAERTGLLETIIDQSGEGIIVADENGVIRVFNAEAERQHGVSMQVVAAPDWAETFGLVADDTGLPLPIEQTPLYRALHGERVRDARWGVRLPNGQVRTLAGTATPLVNADGSRAGAVIITRDVTEAKREEEQRARLREQIARADAESAARERIRLSDEMLKQVPDAVLITDLAGTITRWDGGARRLFGYEAHEAVGRPVNFVHRADVRDALTTEIVSSIQKTGRFFGEVPCVRADGEAILVEVSASTFLGSDGTAIALIGVNRDVTARRRAEIEHAELVAERATRHAVEQSERRFRVLTQETSTVVWTTDPTGTQLHDSPSWRAFTGQSAIELTGGQGWDVVHPDDRSHVVALWNEAVARGGPFATEYRLRRHDGVYVPMSVRAAPVFDDDGSICEWVGANQDISSRIAREQERARMLAHAELGAHVGRAFVTNEVLADQLRQCCEALVTMGAAFARIWTYDATHDVLDLRASAGIYTHIDGAHARIPVGSLKIGRIAESRRPHLTNAVLEDSYVDGAWARREGIRSFAGYPLLAGERLIGVVALFAKHELREETLIALSTVADQIALGIDRDTGERFRELFIGMLGHDLRNPLNAVFMAAHLLRATASETQKRALSRIDNSARRMERMIGQVLDFTRVRSGGGIPLARARCDLAAICSQVVEELAIGRPEPAMELTFSGDATGLWDADRMAQLFSNLIGNALTYGRRDAPVRVSMSAVGLVVRCTVHNLGPAIPQASLPRLFDPFRRARDAKATATQGLGLGLFIAQQIAIAHGGSISVESSDAEGTLFTVLLPFEACP